MCNYESGQKSSAKRKNVLGPLSVGKEKDSYNVFGGAHGSLPPPAITSVLTGYDTHLGKQQKSVFSQNDEISE